MAINPFASKPSGDDEQSRRHGLPVRENPRSGMSLPRPPSSGNDVDNMFGDDEETRALAAAKLGQGRPAPASSSGEDILTMMEKNIRELHRRHVMGGIKVTRFITTEILMKMPEDYMREYHEVIRQGVIAVQTEISDSGRSDVIGNSQAHPTDDTLQDEAYRVVHSVASEFMENQPRYRGTVRTMIITMICNEIIGFGPLEPLWRDQKITEIICNGPFDVQVEMSGRISRVPGVQFRDRNHLMSLIERLYGSVNKVVSRTSAIQGGSLHDKSRMHAVHPSVAPDGPNFNIRRHQKGYIVPADILGWNSTSPEMMEFMGNLIYKGASILVSGGTGTGKTTMLNALSGFIRPNHRVVTLEDDIEMKLNPNKMKAAAMGCLPARPDRPGDTGVTLRDLVKSALRMRPDVIIVGEVRDESAYDLVQALNTGHYGFSTVHANSPEEAVGKVQALVSQGAVMSGPQVLPAISSAFDFIIQLDRTLMDDTRKIVSLCEVGTYTLINEKNNQVYLPVNPIWQFEETGVVDGVVQGEWKKVGEISEERRSRLKLDLEPPLSWEELEKLSRV